MDKIEYRSVIKFLTLEGCKPTEIKNRLDAVYGDSSPSLSTVKEWSKLVKLGRKSVVDEPRTGRPSEVTTPETIELVSSEVLSDRRLKVKEIAARLHLSKTTVLRVLHDHLNMNKVSARWVPRILSTLQMQRRVECCRDFLALYESDPVNVIRSIVTGDETMVLYYDPLSKRESMEWRKPGEKRPRKAKVTQSAKKIMATIFWDAEGILLIDYKERNTTVNAEYYAQLLNQLRQKIKEKRRGKLSLGVRLLHDNAPVHTAVVAKAAVKDCGFTEVAHPPYSPDLAPSDYFLFSKLKSDLRGRKFSTDEEIHAAVEAHFASKDKSYFLEGIELLVKRCKKCIEVKGDYIEK